MFSIFFSLTKVEMTKVSIILRTKLFTEKNLVPDCNTLAYRKSNKTDEHFKQLKNIFLIRIHF